jgi:hypothetical protein
LALQVCADRIIILKGVRIWCGFAKLNIILGFLVPRLWLHVSGSRLSVPECTTFVLVWWGPRGQGFVIREGSKQQEGIELV